MKEIPLTQGKVAIVDDQDYALVSQYKWCAKWNGRHWYSHKSIVKNGRQYTLFMHRFITDAPTGMQVDHVNGDTLDNRRSNLRLCTPSENQQNRGRPISNSSGYKGVRKDGNRWCAAIMVNGKYFHLGSFAEPVEAAHAYDSAARRHFGEYAKTNF